MGPCLQCAMDSGHMTPDEARREAAEKLHGLLGFLHAAVFELKGRIEVIEKRLDIERSPEKDE